MHQAPNRNSQSNILRLGFVPLTDCAPLVMAQELGLFQKHGLRVILSKELGWASIRDKVVYGELDAAQAVAGLPVAATLGVGSIVCECVSAMVLNLNGDAITLSQQLWERGVQDACTLGQEIKRRRSQQPVTLGVVHAFATHNFLLRKWLLTAGIKPDVDVRIVVVPPPQLTANLKAGHLDGFCAGEPWNSVAVDSGRGWVVASSAELSPAHPEKVLMVRQEFAEKCEPQHLALVASLLEACEFCSTYEGREAVARILSRPEYVNVPAAILRRGLNGPFDFGNPGVRATPEFCVFHDSGANEPSADKAAWILQNIRDAGLCQEIAFSISSLGRRLFRSDIFEKALRLRQSSSDFQTKMPQTDSELVYA